MSSRSAGFKKTEPPLVTEVFTFTVLSVAVTSCTPHTHHLLPQTAGSMGTTNRLKQKNTGSIHAERVDDVCCYQNTSRCNFMEVSGTEHIPAKYLVLGESIFMSCEMILYGWKKILSFGCSQYNGNIQTDYIWGKKKSWKFKQIEMLSLGKLNGF